MLEAIVDCSNLMNYHISNNKKILQVYGTTFINHNQPKLTNRIYRVCVCGLIFKIECRYQMECSSSGFHVDLHCNWSAGIRKFMVHGWIYCTHFILKEKRQKKNLFIWFHLVHRTSEERERKKTQNFKVQCTERGPMF